MTNTDTQHVTAPASHHEPVMRIEWTDAVTGARGYLVVDTLVADMATGGTRMRKGCTMTEVEDLARGMSNKTATFDLPIGGAKGGIDFDPKDPGAVGVLTRFCEAMRPFLDRHWVTAEDLGVPQHLIDDVFDHLGMRQSYHAAIERSVDPEATTERVMAGLNAQARGGLLGDVIGGYGVACACLAAAEHWGWAVTGTTVAVQGIGTMGGGAAWYLHDAGMKIVAVADAMGTLYDPDGLDIPALLDTRNAYGEIDRELLPAHVQQLARDSVITTPVDILVPAAVSYALTGANCATVNAKVVVEAANAATTPDAELDLTSRGIAVIPDFVANAGAVAWAWWLLLGYVGDRPDDSFDRLRDVMTTKVTGLLATWDPEFGPLRWIATSAMNRNRVGTEIYIP
ncbi:Glu/Leu/Phe/Val dehydrogenase dimerization domain-containing protein [Antrihabitans cavernicola]|uniref:Glutamate dehydrogenase n=1 Tax=Antrihabitans cavernicola TaxID=2495913 RepID=A0A5A7SFZ9_9NOCA|nr:Glu/Leu/Phe/Val dehydrogenase dimerization domain-containing protein [Spelaeibacter cavernicola]KAA0024369.1 glutamate dehydrogenase [Spelaeibacter cavernicola]